MRLKRCIGLLTGVMLLLSLVPVFVLAKPASQEGQNLLANPGFEGGWHYQGDSYLGKIADGWVAWWVDDAAGKDNTDPSFWQNQRPEYGLVGLEYYMPDQIHGGRQALQYGKRYATHTAGVYQRVSGVPPGATLRFSAWGFVFGKDPDLSRTPGYTRMKVGIDPTGGSNPFAGSVVWSGIVNPVAVGSGSAWQQMSVEAVAQNSTVTVFVYSSPEWPMNDALTSQWDDTSLAVTTPAETPTGTAPPPPPTSPPGTPLPPPATSTPHPDGSVIHTIRSGETIWGIAIQYATGANITPEEMLAQIKRLNNNPTIIYPGQDLVIAVPGDSNIVALTASEGESESPAPAAEGESAPATAGGSEQVSAATGIEQSVAAGGALTAAEIAASSSTLCVSAYHDRNSDGMRDPTTEELLSNASFTLSSEQGVVGSYISDGSSEPYCFAQIIPGTYMVQLTKPSGYNTTTPEYWAVPLPAGATANVEFGHRRDPNAPASEDQSLASAPGSGQPSSPEELLQAAKNRSTESDSESQSLLSSLGEIAIGVSGIFVLLLAGAVGVAFIASRRRA